MQPTILVADDDESIRLILATLLEEAGYHILCVEDGRAAVEQAVQRRPDVAILDVLMPEMDGFAACRTIKTDRRTADIPVLLLTALAQTTSKVQGLECGADDYITKPFETAELLARLRNALAHKSHHDALATQALTDPLTGLTNRRGLEQQLDQLLAHSERAAETLSLLVFDVDHFKAINDTYGHETGDVVLVALAQRAREATRAQDVLGRFGGEEFLGILPSAGRDAALTAAERLRAHVAEAPVATPSGAVGVTISVGVATTVPGKEVSRGGLLAAADRAMYVAKHRGRNCVAHADGQPTAPLARPKPPDIARALVEALALVHADTAAHARAVADACWEIGSALRLPLPERSRVALAGLLHDIGKLGLPRALLDTPAPLDERGNVELRAHIHYGEQLLQRFAILDPVAPLVAAQHEWWDGSGYPRGWSGEQIPLGSRIVAVANTYALLSHMPSRGAAGAAGVSATVLRSAAGTRFDPTVVNAAIRVLC
jgi:diguanylate cyclase (GGDEF)-like protein